RQPRSTLIPYTTLFRSKENFQENITDSMDAVGLSDFLPNTSLINDSEKKMRESINRTIESITTKTKSFEKVNVINPPGSMEEEIDRKSTRLNSSHVKIS